MAENIAVTVLDQADSTVFEHRRPDFSTASTPLHEDMQQILTEMSTIAFVSSIIATISLPSTINPIERLNTDLESFQGTLPFEARQWIYGFLWCASATCALSSMFAAFAITYGTMSASRRGPQALTAAVSYLKSTRFSSIAARPLPPFLRSSFMLVLDTFLFCVALCSVFSPSAWQVPILLLVGAVFLLVCGTGFNIYLMLPQYFGFHVASQACIVGTLALGFVVIAKAPFMVEAIAQHQSKLKAVASSPTAPRPAASAAEVPPEAG